MSLKENDEFYTVKLWCTNDVGFREQKEIVVLAPSHEEAGRIAKIRFNKPEIVSIKYQ